MTPFDVASASLQPGVTLIEASAGTGKTYSIAGLVLRLVLEKHLQIREILAVTFTEAATQELRDRVRRRLQAALEDIRRGRSEDAIVEAFLRNGDIATGVRELDVALQSFDEAQIFTIHGFCQRMLNDHAFESGARFDTVLVTDPKPLFQEVARDFWRLRFYQAKPLLPTLAMAWQTSPDDWVELLERTRRHPDLVVLPPAEAKSCDDLLQAAELAFAALTNEWNRHRREIEKLLREHGGLSRDKKKFGLERVEEIVAKVAEACASPSSRRDELPHVPDSPRRVPPEFAAPESIRALKEITSEAIAAGTKPTGTAPEHLIFALSTEFCQAVEALFNQLTHELLEFAETELPKRKARTNTVTYDDLITGLRNALKQQGSTALARAIGEKYSAVLIDEFQDTDPAQYEIFRTIFRSQDHRLFFIGDPKQAIYGFRGADLFTYFAAARIADRKFTLVTNWRSEEPLLAAINGLFAQTKEPFVFPQIQYHEIHVPKKPIVKPLTSVGKVGSAMNFRLVRSPGDRARLGKDTLSEMISGSVSTDVAALNQTGSFLGDRAVKYSDMAVLVRTHSQAEKIQSVLRERGIPSVVQSDRSVFASDEAGELQQFLQGVIDPRRDTLLKGALATTLIGFDAKKLFDLDRDDQARQAWLDRFSDWRLQWINGCFTAMFRHLLVSQHVRARLVHLPAGERRLTNFLHLAELLHEAESTQSLAPDAVCSWLREQRESTRLSEDRFQLRLESDDEAVQIVTIHKCKGLEYPIVFCPFLWLPAEFKGRNELLFHDRESANRLTFDLRGKKAGARKHQDWQSEEVKAEELRLLYVAVTRAMNRCYIYLPEQNTEKSPLEQLFQPLKEGSLADRVIEFARKSKGAVTASASEGDDRRGALPRAQGLAAASPSGSETLVSATLMSRPFGGKISRIAMTASFSGLNTAATELDELDSDTLTDTNAIIETERDSSDLSIFTFARGRRTGDFFHDVLEHMDFQNLEGVPEVVESRLGAYGFARTSHRPAINEILLQLAEIELEPGMSLRRIPMPKRLSELEFFYPLAHLTPAILTKTVAKCGALAGDIRARMGGLRFDPVEGFMRGFLDLLFRFKDRYHLVDWKSNWLGSQPADYGAEGMRRAMLEHNYFLQYHFYTLAADLFLEKRVPGYSYESHFGGVFYIFLRGIDPKDPSRGVFRDRPTAKTVRTLRNLIA